MGTERRLRPPSWVVGLALAACAGCTLTIQPPIRIGLAADKPCAEAAPAPPAPAPGPGPVLRPPPPLPGIPNEQLSVLMQKMASLEDDRKALAARLQQTELQLREKDQTAVQASYEIQESTKQIRKTRDEMQRWKQEMDDLRSKIRGIEKENKATLEAILKGLEGQPEVDKEKENRATLDALLKSIERSGEPAKVTH